MALLFLATVAIAMPLTILHMYASSNRSVRRCSSRTRRKNVNSVGSLSPVSASLSFQVDKRERDANDQCHAKVELQLWLTGAIPSDLDHHQEPQQ
jgi:hypothetical protein